MLPCKHPVWNKIKAEIDLSLVSELARSSLLTILREE